MKKLTRILCFAFLLPLTLQAQEESKNIHVEKERKFKLIQKKDTNYIAPNQYNMVFRLEQSTWQEHFKLGTHSGTKQHLNFSPDLSPKVGLYLGYRWLFLGYNFNLRDRKRNEPKKTELSLNFYDNKFGVDLHYRKTGGDVKLRSYEGFDTQDASSSEDSPFGGLSSKLFGVNASWIFNHSKYSQQAAFRHNTVQLQDAGSFIANISYTRQTISFDHDILPGQLTGNVNPKLKFDRLKYSNYSLGFGYGYNWVLSKKWLAGASFIPSISYKKPSIEGYELANEKKNIGFDFITRASVVYNNGKHFAGAMLVFNAYHNRWNNLCMRHTFGALRIYAGMNFWKKKKYREK